MVKVVIAGATSGVGREVIHQIALRKKHEIVGLSRKDVSPNNPNPDGVKYIKVDYTDKASLVYAFKDASAVLSFLTDMSGTALETEKLMIDAAVEAGVKRFAPSQWATRSNTGIGHYDYKNAIQKYLEELNSKETVLEYSLFQPGLFMNYFSAPHKSTEYMTVFQLFIDMEKRRVLQVGDGNQVMTTTTLQDIGSIVAEALEYPHPWPRVGGISGTTMKFADYVKLAERITGDSFAIEKLDPKDLEKGELNSSWCPQIEHQNVPPEIAAQVSKGAIAEIMDALVKRAWHVSDEWNKALPQYKMTTAEEFFKKYWETKK